MEFLDPKRKGLWPNDNSKGSCLEKGTGYRKYRALWFLPAWGIGGVCVCVKEREKGRESQGGDRKKEEGRGQRGRWRQKQRQREAVNGPP